MSRKTVTPQRSNVLHRAAPPRLSVEQAFLLATQHHAQGRLPEAEAMIKQILQAQPGHAHALHLWGIIANQVGNNAAAIELIGKAIESDNNIALFHANLCVICRNAGRITEAIAHGERSVTLDPQMASAYSNLGLAYHDNKEFDKDEACQLQALKLQPALAPALYNMGCIMRERKQSLEAIAYYRQAIAANPAYLEALNNLGGILAKEDRQNEALGVLAHALKLNPNYSFAHCNIGNAFKASARIKEAEASYRRAIQLNPDYAEAHHNLAILLMDQGRLEEAEANLRRALEIKPDFAEAYSTLGTTLKELGRLDEAEASCRRALEINPDLAESHNNLSGILLDAGRMNEAEAGYRQALSIKPDYIHAHSNLLFLLNHKPGNDPTLAYAEARLYGQVVADKVTTPFTQWSSEKQPKRLRIGFVSGDFRRHSVGYFLENILSQFDQRCVELVAYPTSPKVDDLTARIKPCFSAWHPLYGLNDEAAARLIHRDGVHVLVDLSGHTSDNRLPVFAWKPAPLQASWLGYLNTTGVAAMDYLIADSWTLPVAEEAHFTEQILRLPESYLCFTPPDVEVAVAPLPALNNTYVTFGSFNNLTKMNDEVVAVWSRVLASVPASRLFLKTQQLQDASVRQHTLDRFAKHGIDAGRLILEGSVPQRAEHIAAYNRVDIALDPFPYPGITTSVESLWMGVPVLTLAGERFISRQGVGLSMNAGLPEWIATDADDYVARAVLHAGDLPGLSALRNRLRQQVTASPLFDAPRFARHFEAAMWKIWNEFSSNT